MAKVKSPEIYDPYLGKMWGNILDQYDNPAYNLKLYLKPETVGAAPTTTGSSASATQGTRTTPADLLAQGVNPSNIPAGSPLDPNLGRSGTAARQDTPASSSSPAPSDKKIVVLAQTGVTASQIDNVELDGYADASASSEDTVSLKGRFTIIQPGAANFLDQIQYARKYLGASEDQLTTQDFDMYLDVTFLGYDSDPNDNELGGEPTIITDVVTYKLRPTKISVKVDNTGSQYDFEVAISNTVGYADTIYKIPQNFSLIGTTITEFIKDFEAKYNQALVESSTEYTPDQVAFNLDPLLKGTGAVDSLGSSPGDFIKDETIPNQANSQEVEARTQPRFPNPSVSTAEEQRKEADGASKSGKATEKIIPGATLTVKEGDTIFNIIGKILLMNKEFQSKVTRKEDVNNPGNNKVKENQTFIHWYDIHCQIENIKWDKKRNMYAKKYTYTPYIVKDARSDIALTTKEFDYLKEKGKVTGGESEVPLTALATKRLQDLYNAGALSKSYFYIFTGLNDQIINLDITYDNALTLLMPPKGGMIGDFSVTTGPALSNSEPSNTNMTLGDKLEAAKTTLNKESLVDVFKQLKGLASDMNGLAQGLGRSVAEIKAAAEDVTGATARKLASSLDGKTVDSLLKKVGASNSSDPADTPGTATQINVQNNGPYAPEVSGVLYSDDLVQPGGNISSDELESAGLVVLDSKAPTNAGHATPVTKSLASPLSGITSDGPASVLMGYVYRARQSTNFLLNIELTLRGDPYWLTKINSDKFTGGKPSRDVTLNPMSSKYYFLLTIGTPSRYDYNINDEDENTGYWSDGRTSGIFSGLYFPIAWKNRFNNGIFTTELKATKEIAVPLQWIKRVPPGETPPDWDALGVNDNTISDFIFATQKTTVPPGDKGGGVDVVVKPEDLPALQLGGAKSKEAKAAAEKFLGRSLTDKEWELTIRAVAGESGGNSSEDAAIAGVILNRVKSGRYPNSVEGVLYQKNQFQAVTGTANDRSPNQGFANPTQQQIARATNNILNNLPKVNNTWLNFTSNNPAAYGPGTDPSFLTRARNTPGAQVIGGSIFFTAGGGG